MDVQTHFHVERVDPDRFGAVWRGERGEEVATWRLCFAGEPTDELYVDVLKAWARNRRDEGTLREGATWTVHVRHSGATWRTYEVGLPRAGVVSVQMVAL